MIYFEDTASDLNAYRPGNLQTIYDHSVSRCLSSHTLFCPHCGSRNTLKASGFYSRYCFNSLSDITSQAVLQVMMMKCTCCSHESALVPEWFCAYSHFTYPMIIEILDAYFHRFQKNKLRTAAFFNISRKALSNLIYRFMRDLIIASLTQLFLQAKSQIEIVLQTLRSRSEALFAFLDEFFHYSSEPWMTRHFNFPRFKARARYILCRHALE